MKVPFGSLLGVSESSPVAGAIQGSYPCLILRCRTRTRVAKSAQPATQLLSVHCLYQPQQKSASPNRFFRTNVYRRDSVESPAPPNPCHSDARAKRAGGIRFPWCWHSEARQEESAFPSLCHSEARQYRARNLLFVCSVPNLDNVSNTIPDVILRRAKSAPKDRTKANTGYAVKKCRNQSQHRTHTSDLSSRAKP